MLVFLRTLDPRIPKWQLHESLIGTNPGNSSFSHQLLVVNGKRQQSFSFNRFFRTIKYCFLTFWCSTGLGFRPLPPEDNVESTLIWYRGTNKENFEVWTNALDEFLSREFNYTLPFFSVTLHLWRETIFIVTSYT
jgi:sodium/potassium-transporting ATPase subunit beta